MRILRTLLVLAAGCFACGSPRAEEVPCPASAQVVTIELHREGRLLTCSETGPVAVKVVTTNATGERLESAAGECGGEGPARFQGYSPAELYEFTTERLGSASVRPALNRCGQIDAQMPLVVQLDSGDAAPL